MQAGRVLADLHLNYESVEMYPIEVDGDDQNPGKVVKMKWGKKKDPETGKKVDDHSVLVYNGNLAFRGGYQHRSTVTWLTSAPPSNG